MLAVIATSVDTSLEPTAKYLEQVLIRENSSSHIEFSDNGLTATNPKVERKPSSFLNQV